MTRAIAVCVSASILTIFSWTAPALAQRLEFRGSPPAGMHHGPRPSHPIVTPPIGGRVGPPRHAVPPRSGWGGGRVLYAPRHGHGWGYPHRGYVYPGYGYGYGGYTYASPAYVQPPTYDVPAPTYNYPYPASTSFETVPPMPTVIEHATGRYELRGDGLTSPYRWVWVPNPPEAPPSSGPPTSTPPPPPASAPADPSSRRSTLYRWTDRDGTVHWTDNLERVPKEQRAKMEVRSP